MSMRYVRMVAVGILVVLSGLLVWYFNLGQWLSVAVITQLVADVGWYGGLAFIGLYAVASMLFIPGTPLTILAGVLFGPVYGVVYTIIGATIGATLLFLVARYAGRGFIVEYVARHARLQAYDAQLAKDGFMTVLILRFIPLFPFNGLNLALGLTPVPIRAYILGTFLGIIPGTAALVYFGTALATVNAWHIAIAVGVLVALTYAGKLLATRFKKHE